jgi:ribosomal protein L29
MSFPKYSELNHLNTIFEIEKELFILQKSLFDLRMKKFITKNIKSHSFFFLKHRIAQLKYKKSILKKIK